MAVTRQNRTYKYYTSNHIDTSSFNQCHSSVCYDYWEEDCIKCKDGVCCVVFVMSCLAWSLPSLYLCGFCQCHPYMHPSTFLGNLFHTWKGYVHVSKVRYA